MSRFHDEEGSCTDCYGKGRREYFHPTTNTYVEDECAHCRGTGLDLTEVGLELLDLLDRLGVTRTRNSASRT